MHSNFIRFLLVKITFIFVWFFFINNALSAKELSITILHTNDLHSHELTYQDKDKKIGGFAKIGYLIKEYKEKTPNAIAIDAGDIFQGSPLYTYYHGDCEVNCLNKMGYDIYTIGNHEFDDGPTNLAKQLSKAKFTIINSNLDFSQYKEFDNLVKPFVIKVIDGQKIAFVGAITPDIGQVSLTLQKVKVKSIGPQWYKPIQDTVNKLKSEGINKIILVSHCGVELDKELAQKIPDVDAIIGGHSHTKLSKPIIINHDDGSSTVIVQTGCYGRYLGILKLSFEPNGFIDLSNTKDKLIPITTEIPDDKSVLAIINEDEKPIEKITNEVIGESNVYLSKLGSRSLHDYGLGDIICDAIYEAGIKYGATISFQNRGGTRTGIEKGPITLGQIQSMLPFKNHLVIASITGQALKNVLETSLTKLPSARFLDVHGLKILYDPDSEIMHRIKYLYAFDNKTNTYLPVDEKQNYRIIINSYTFDGGEGYNFGEVKDKVEIPMVLSEAFVNFVKNHKTLDYPDKGRILPIYNYFQLQKDNAIKILTDNLKDINFDKVYLVGGDNIGISSLENHLMTPFESALYVKNNLKLNSETTVSNFKLKTVNKYYSIIIKDTKNKKYLTSYPVESNSQSFSK